MLELKELVPNGVWSEDCGTHLNLSNNVVITDSEEIAIAVIDSLPKKGLVVVKHNSDIEYTMYSNDCGVMTGDRTSAKSVIAEYLCLA